MKSRLIIFLLKPKNVNNKKLKIKIAVKHQYCNKAISDKQCACAFYIRVDDYDPRYLFIDHCDSAPRAHLELKYFDKDEVKTLKRGDFPRINCSQPIYNDNNETEWRSIPLFKKYFQCGKLVSSPCNTLVVRATYLTKSIKAKIDIGCLNQINPLSRIVIYPKIDINYPTGGLCGIRFKKYVTFFIYYCCIGHPIEIFKYFKFVF